MPNDSIPNSTDGIKLWDEILKAIADAMPEQLFPLFKEVYGKEYPEGTSIRLLRPRLGKKSGKPLTEKELTEFVGEAILVLRKEREAGYLTKRQHDDYITLFRHAADRVLAGHPEFQKEVDKMTKPMIILPSVMAREMEAQLTAKIEAQLTAKIEAQLKAQLADKDAEIDRLRKLLAQQAQEGLKAE